MKKLFLAICFIVLGLSGLAQGAVTEMGEAAKSGRGRGRDANVVQTKPEPIRSEREFRNFLRERLKVVGITEDDPDSGPEVMNMQPSDEEVTAAREAEKPIYDRIYEEAMRRAMGGLVEPQSGFDSSFGDEQTGNEPKKFDFEVIDVELPFSKEKIKAPAKEHIAFLFSDIAITPTGLVNVKETVTVVANGEALKYGLVKGVPLYTTSRSGVQSKVDVSLGEVLINGKAVDYKMIKRGGNIYFVPKKNAVLPNGIYTYEFNYIMDRRLWEYEDFKELYFDVTGSQWNLVIGRAGALIRLPNGAEPLGYTVLVGYPKYLNEKQVLLSKEPGAVGLVAARPLFVGEGMHIVASVPADVFEKPSVGRKLIWLINDYGDVIFSGLGLLAILISYMLSWQQMRSLRGGSGGLKRTAMMLRYLLKEKFDKVSFGGFLLELFRRNIIEFGSGPELIKKSDNLKGLSSGEKKAVNELFVGRESVVKVDQANALKFKRAFKAVENDTKKKFKKHSWQLNFGYLLFGVAMLGASLFFIAFNSINPLVMMINLVIYVLVYALAVWLFKRKFNNKQLTMGCRIFGGILAFCGWFMLAHVISWLAALLILGMVYVIFTYTSMFGKKDGLMRANVRDVETYANFIAKNANALDFGQHQANVFALEMAEQFPMNDRNKNIYRLVVVEDIVNRL